MSRTTDLALEEAVVAIRVAGFEGNAGESLSPGVRRQAAVVALGRRAAAPLDNTSLMRDAAALLAETLDVDHFGAAQSAAGGTQWSFWLAAAGETEPAIEANLPAGGKKSMVGHALAVGHPVVASDLGREERFVDDLLLRHGMQSAIVSPILLGEQSLGAIGVFSAQPREFTQEDVLFADTVAHLLAATITRKKAEQALKEQHRLHATILETIDAVVLELNSEGRITAINRACRKVTGFTSAELKQRPIGSALLIPEEVGLVQRVFARLHNGESPIEFEGYLLTKHGERRRIAWSFAAMCGPDSEVASMIGTGVDITEQHAARQELERTRAVADETNQSLNELLTQIEEGVNRLPDEDGQPFQRLPDDEYFDRRQRPRRSYPYLQLIAPIVEGKLPDRRTFQEVRCRDIAAGGFSYLADAKPKHDSIVVAFGAAPYYTYLAAEIVHSSPLEVDDELMYLVGCRYRGRVEYA